MITVTLSAYSTNGLIYFRGSPETRDFLAIQLEDGAVVVKARVARVININLRSKQANYADGRTHKIRTMRQDNKIHLQIDEETKISADIETPAGSDHTDHVLDIPNSDHYIGGLPPDFNRTPFVDDGLKFDGFFGCIQSGKPLHIFTSSHPRRKHLFSSTYPSF